MGIELLRRTNWTQNSTNNVYKTPGLDFGAIYGAEWGILLSGSFFGASVRVRRIGNSHFLADPTDGSWSLEVMTAPGLYWFELPIRQMQLRVIGGDSGGTTSIDFVLFAKARP